MKESNEMMAYMVKNLSMLLMEHYTDLSMEQALNIVFNSDTYQKVLNEKTHLYYQSPRYVYSFLEEEIKTGKPR
ncbi:MAG: hypothetical protein IAB08_08170 [Bacteroidetes bacterium]|uniref:DUF3791 domain-containing protein n=1 Tax=Candidatus Pullibacteroides excrementavium TaxID=2840905 RepID=A0A9D9DVL4_9BACT|nr:hypothetical protein [Candidatus Pullibacteroides excrementavium]